MLKHRGLCLCVSDDSFYRRRPVAEVRPILDEARHQGYNFLWLWPHAEARLSPVGPADDAAVQATRRDGLLAEHAASLDMGVGLVWSAEPALCGEPAALGREPLPTPQQTRSRLQRTVGILSEFAGLSGILAVAGGPEPAAAHDAVARAAELVAGVREVAPGTEAFLWVTDTDEARRRRLVEQHPDWLDGIVAHGCGVLSQWQELGLPQRVAILCPVELSVPDETGFEWVSPRPGALSTVFVQLAHARADGFIGYSTGVQDDLNKVLAAQFAQTPTQPAEDVLADYALRYFAFHGATARLFAREMQRWEVAEPVAPPGPALGETAEEPSGLWRRLGETIGSGVIGRHWRWRLIAGQAQARLLLAQIGTPASLAHRVIRALTPIADSATPTALATAAGQARAHLREASDALEGLRALVGQMHDEACLNPPQGDPEGQEGDELDAWWQATWRRYAHVERLLTETVRRIEGATELEAARSIVLAVQSRFEAT